MNRRRFFARTLGAVVAATVAPLMARSQWRGIASPGAFIPLRWRGVPVTYDKNVPNGVVYFLNKDTVVMPVSHQFWRNR